MNYTTTFILPPLDIRTPDTIRTFCADNTTESEIIGFAGLLTKEDFEEWVLPKICDPGTNPVKPHTFDIPHVQTLIDKSLAKCTTLLPIQNHLSVFVYPSYDDFVYNEMNGVTGYCIYQKTILLFLNPTHPNWEQEFCETIAHEYHHAIFRLTHTWDTVFQGLQAEGLAEHFREQAIGGSPAPWSQALPQSELSSWLSNISSDLDSTDMDIYQEIFFSEKKYPHWLGYSLGYWMIQTIRDKHPELSWEELTEMESQEFKEFFLQ